MSKARARTSTKAKTTTVAKPPVAATTSPLTIETVSVHAAAALKMDPSNELALGWVAAMRVLDVRTWPPTEWAVIAQLRQDLERILGHLSQKAAQR